MAQYHCHQTRGKALGLQLCSTTALGRSARLVS